MYVANLDLIHPRNLATFNTIFSILSHLICFKRHIYQKPEISKTSTIQWSRWFNGDWRRDRLTKIINGNINHRHFRAQEI